MVKKKKNKIASEEDQNYTIKDLSIDEITPNIIAGYVVTMFEGHHTIALPMIANGQHFKTWSRGRGGVYSRDVLHHSQNKPHGKYILFKGYDKYFIARLISEDEHLAFKTLNLIHGEIKDTSYMILKHLKEGDKLTDVKQNIFNELETADDMVAISLPEQSDIKKENKPRGITISLFSE